MYIIMGNKALTNEVINTTEELNSMFEWYSSNFAQSIQKAFNDFFGEKFNLKLVSLSQNVNVLFQGDQYFVTRIRIDKNYDLYFRCSSIGLKIILDDILGAKYDYDISNISDLEAKIISTFNDFVCNQIIDLIIKPEKGIKRKNFDTINLTFFIKGESDNCGKFIVSIPKDLVNPEVLEDKSYDISKFNMSLLDTDIILGSTMFKLKELKSLEADDIVVLDNSNISNMHLIYKDYEKDFSVVPRNNLIMQDAEDFLKGANMSESSELPQNLWDSIQVEMGAKLESVKITLGELRAIAKGQVMDLSSIYNSKVSLIVENQVVAKGDLVIVNDKYGVKIEEVFEAISHGEYIPPAQNDDDFSQEHQFNNEEGEYQNQDEMMEDDFENSEYSQEGLDEEYSQDEQAEGEEEFDYSDFNLDDQDI